MKAKLAAARMFALLDTTPEMKSQDESHILVSLHVFLGHINIISLTNKVIINITAKRLRTFWFQNPDPESESSPFDVESIDTDYKLNP